MAIYHLHVGIVKRSSGRSSVAAAAYRSAEKLKSEHDNVTHNYSPKSSSVNASAYRSGEKLGEYDYTRKQGVVHTEILLPENAPREFEDRATLWNAVQSMNDQISVMQRVCENSSCMNCRYGTSPSNCEYHALIDLYNETLDDYAQRKLVKKG